MSKPNTFFPKVGEIAHHGVIRTPGTTTIADAVILMEENNLSDIVYDYKQDHAIFTVEDLMRYRHQERNLFVPLDSLTPHLLRCVDEEENVLNILPLFEEGSSRYLGVKNSADELEGIVSYTDVLASVDPAVMMEHKTLGEVLEKARVEMIDADTPAEDVLEQLIYVDDAMLVAEKNILIGIVTAKDVIRMIRDAVDMTQAIRHYMTKPVITINHQETIKAAVEHLKVHKFKRAIVVDDDNHVIGRITQRELISITYGRWAELMKLHAHELGELVHVLQSKNVKLEQDSLTDPLTGAGNRRMLNQAIEAEIGRFYRQEMSSFSILLLDVDFFKKINDSYGHPFGDRVLVALCKKAKTMLRTSDTLTRWGGEEFAILLPTADLKAATSLAERMRAELANIKLDDRSFTVSIGAAEYQRGESLEILLHRVDQALYQAKQTGRNKVVAAS